LNEWPVACRVSIIWMRSGWSLHKLTTLSLWLDACAEQKRQRQRQRQQHKTLWIRSRCFGRMDIITSNLIWFASVSMLYSPGKWSGWKLPIPMAHDWSVMKYIRTPRYQCTVSCLHLNNTT
jgi:hypothetical protein